MKILFGYLRYNQLQAFHGKTIIWEKKRELLNTDNEKQFAEISWKIEQRIKYIFIARKLLNKKKLQYQNKIISFGLWFAHEKILKQ